MRKNHKKTDEKKISRKKLPPKLAKKLSKNCGGFEKLKLDDFFSSEWHSLSPNPYIYDLKKILLTYRLMGCGSRKIGDWHNRKITKPPKNWRTKKNPQIWISEK